MGSLLNSVTSMAASTTEPMVHDDDAILVVSSPVDVVSTSYFTKIEESSVFTMVAPKGTSVSRIDKLPSWYMVLVDTMAS